MKHFFKYASGYLNLDGENLYLTTSGNWEEAAQLTEKGDASQKANRRRIKTNTIAFTTLLIIAGAVIVFAVGRGKLRFFPLLFVFFGLYKVNQYFRREMGNRYKIPLAKIEAIEQQEDGVKITFRNADNEPDHEIVPDLDPAGIMMLMQLKVVKPEALQE
jgi:hypothetical protein